MRITTWKTMRNLAVLLLLVLPPSLSARTLCVFSLVGAQGELWEQMEDYRVAALQWGEPLSLRVFTDERIAAEDLKAGLCDGLMMTGMRARQFVPFTGSIDAIGGLHNYQSLQVLIELLADPRLAASMRHGAYETAGILPLGAAYLHINDRAINSVEKMAGHTMAVFDNDRAQILMAEHIGVRPVLSDVSNFSSKFNNGVVDVIAAPAVAYRPLELYRGVGLQGVVLKLTTVQLTLQLVLRHERFSPEFMARSRHYFSGQFDRTLKVIRTAEDDLLFFYPPPDKDRERYAEMMNESRRFLIEAGVYDKDMMRWLKKVRCKVSPARAECVNGGEW
ncbi:putative solute-binding protein [Alloalcanivorax dieselolei]|nr:putative solute-binding protein [Alloalcanivorax dieselolei]